MSHLSTIISIVTASLAISAASASAAIVFSDNWDDGTVDGPVLTSGGDWIASGDYTADGSNPGGHTSPVAQTLTPRPVADTSIEAYFGNTVAYAPVTLTYEIRQADIQTSNNVWSTFLIDSVSGLNLQFLSIPNPGYFGTTGFGLRYDGNSAMAGFSGTAPTSTDDDFHVIQIVFSPNVDADLSEVNAYYDGVQVGSWGVPNGLTRVDTVRLHSSSDISYNIDNLTIDATVVPEPAAASLLLIGSAVGMLRRRR